MDALDTAHPLPADLKTEVLTTSPWGRSGVQVVGINVCHLIDLLFPNTMDLSAPRNYAAEDAAITAWCADHGAHYYARPRETFDYCEAAREALSRGLSRVVYEDLS